MSLHSNGYMFCVSFAWLCMHTVSVWMNILTVCACVCIKERWKNLPSPRNLTLICGLPLCMWTCFLACEKSPRSQINSEQKEGEMKCRDYRWMSLCGEPVCETVEQDGSFMSPRGKIIWRIWPHCSVGAGEQKYLDWSSGNQEYSQKSRTSAHSSGALGATHIL